LTQGGRITGQVVDSDGNGIEGIEVTAEHWKLVASPLLAHVSEALQEQLRLARRRQRSGPGGYFDLDGLMFGEWIVSVPWRADGIQQGARVEVLDVPGALDDPFGLERTIVNIASARRAIRIRITLGGM
jgi:hypothetical protein